jgi:hypothetical protein
MILHDAAVGLTCELRNIPQTPAATSNSPTRGRVKFPHLARQDEVDNYASVRCLATRVAASFSRQLLPSNLSR